MTPEQAKERGIKVRTLEWAFGLAQPFGTMLFAYHVRGPFPDDGGWKSLIPGGGWTDHASKESARAACQDDYEARILEVLE